MKSKLFALLLDDDKLDVEGCPAFELEACACSLGLGLVLVLSGMDGLVAELVEEVAPGLKV